VGWLAVADGSLQVPSTVPPGELVIFEDSRSEITVVAEDAARFVIGSAPKHRHDLALGSYSVHTSEEALRKAEDEIRRIGSRLRAEGKKSYALTEF